MADGASCLHLWLTGPPLRSFGVRRHHAQDCIHRDGPSRAMKLIEILILIGIVGGVILARARVGRRTSTHTSFRMNKWMFFSTLILSLPILNIAAFIAMAIYLGGAAVNGRIQDG